VAEFRSNVRLALFGGTFDPIHSGHLRAARVAARKFRLDKVLFVPSAYPPHKKTEELTPFSHRFAMVALACANQSYFVPSLLEAPEAGSEGAPQYSIDTVLKVRRTLGEDDELYFLVGVDALLDLPHWKDHQTLLNSVNFIVVSRPGFNAGRIAGVLPQLHDARLGALPGVVGNEKRVPSAQVVSRQKIELAHTTIHVLYGLDMDIASTEIRDALRRGQKVPGLVPPVVEKYIMKEELYRPEPDRMVSQRSAQPGARQ
jgi:nicotinate-nucleotide adenylyltransferase